MKKLALLAMLLIGASLSQGCLSAGIYRTGRTLDPGRGDFGLTWNATQIRTADITDDQGNVVTEGVSLAIPNIIPELGYHIGVVDNLELGGRISPGTGYLEVDAKYRFFRSKDDKMHIAVAPAVGYSAFFFVSGLTATLPLIFTYDFNDRAGVNLAPYIAYQDLSLTDDTAIANFGGSYLQGGGSLGFMIKGRKFYIMPAIDVARSISDFGSNSAFTFATQTYVRFGITLGWISGQELEGIERIEKKLDVIHEEQLRQKEKDKDDEEDEEEEDGFDPS